MTEPAGPARLRAGDVYWVRPDAVVGREQAGRRPYVIVASDAYLEVVDTLAFGVPITTTDRGWPNHVAVRAGEVAGFAMTEQLRTLSRERFDGYAGHVGEGALESVREWLADYLGF